LQVFLGASDVEPMVVDWLREMPIFHGFAGLMEWAVGTNHGWDAHLHVRQK
jgi:hypothetical protein